MSTTPLESGPTNLASGGLSTQIGSYTVPQFMKETFEVAGIDPDSENNREKLKWNRFLKSCYSWADFAEYYFRDPEDEDKPLRLEASQRAAINSIQFGYNIDMYPWAVKAKYRPKGIIMIWPRQYGKTTAVAIAAACAFIFKFKKYNIGTFSINEDGAIGIMNRIIRFVENSNFKYMIFDDNTKRIRKIPPPGKSRPEVKCVAYPASEGVRGRSIHLGLIDEAAGIKDSILYGAIIYTLRRVGERWIMLSTPRGYQGEFIRYYQIGMDTRPIICKSCRKVYQQDQFPQFSFKTYKMPRNMNPCTCGETNWVYGIGEYTVVPVDPWNCSWKTVAEIETELRLAGNTPLARQEILGEIIYEGSNVFAREILENAMNKNLDNFPKPRKFIKNYTIGMDFGKVHDASVLCVMHYDNRKGKAILDYIYIIDASYKNIDYHDIREDFLDIVKLYNPMWIVPDSTGVGDSVVDEMYLDIKQSQVDAYGRRLRTRIYSNKEKNKKNWVKQKRKGFYFDTRSKNDLIENLVAGYGKRKDIWIPHENIPGVNRLWREMLAFSYDYTESKNIRYGIQEEHDDCVIAHALAYWACKEKPFISLPSKVGGKYVV